MTVLSKNVSKKVAQGNATRESLLSAARDLFGTQGYFDTSLDAIVHHAGVTKGAFYHHFEGKEELFLKVVETVKRELSRAAFVVHLSHEADDGNSGSRGKALRTVADLDNEEIWNDLLTCCRRYIELHSDPQVRRIVLLDARSVLTWDQWQTVEREHGTVMLRANLRRAMQRGIIQRLPLYALATLVAGALIEACMLVANADEPERALAESITIVERLLEGLRIWDDAGPRRPSPARQ